MTDEELNEIIKNLEPITSKENDNEICIPVNGVDSSEGIYTIPCPISAKYLLQNKPSLPPEIIKGVLRQGAKMSVTARSKAGKSFLMLELAIALASGTEWLGHKCEKSRVLYINTELQEAEIADRYEKVKKALGITEDIDENISFWNLRGHAAPLKQYANTILSQVKKNNVQMVIIDPIYKLMEGSENEQAIVTAFCNSVDVICKSEASVAIVHHHRKGNLGDNDAQDRGSGSGVFARDADAMIDLIQLFNPGNEAIDPRNSSVTAWRVSHVFRSFPSPEDMTILFDYPIHKKDVAGLAQNAKPKTSQSKAGVASGNRREVQKQKRMDEYRRLREKDPDIKTAEAAQRLGVSERTIQKYNMELGQTN